MPLRAAFGRPLRLAIVGGGPDSWIGALHRGAAEMDGWFRTTAGVFSSDPARSRAAGAALGLDPARSYGSVAEMLQAEVARADGVDAGPSTTSLSASSATFTTASAASRVKPPTNTARRRNNARSRGARRS